MTATDSMDRIGILAAAAVFVALTLDGMDLQMLALALPSITKELHLTTTTAGALSTYTLLGMGFGGAFAGWLADRIGRVRVVWYSVITFSACTGLVALCQTYFQLAGMRFISGLGLGSLYCIGTLLAAEYVPTRMRTTVLGILQAGWSAGYVIAALLSARLIPLYGWRSLFICAAPPGVIALALLWKVPDPPSWRARSHCRAEGSFAMIWSDRAVRRTFLLWSITAIALQFGYYGATSWLPSYLVKDLGVNLQNTGWYVAATYAMGMIGKILAGYVADIIGRRAMWVLAGLSTAIYLPILIHFATPGNVAVMLLLFGFLYGSPYAVNATYQSESFPARVRATAVATSYNIGRVGSTLSPLLIGMAASKYSIGLGLALLGISYAVCALVPGFFIREKMFDPKAIESQPAETVSA